MMDLLPFLRIRGNTPEEQIAELVRYITQFKEELESILMNISTDNLSAELKNKLIDMGADIRQNRDEGIEEISQVSGMSRYDLKVNFETGHLEY